MPSDHSGLYTCVRLCIIRAIKPTMGTAHPEADKWWLEIEDAKERVNSRRISGSWDAFSRSWNSLCGAGTLKKWEPREKAPFPCTWKWGAGSRGADRSTFASSGLRSDGPCGWWTSFSLCVSMVRRAKGQGSYIHP